MIVGRKHKYLMLCPPKTGTLSVRTWLIKNYEGEPRNPYHCSVPLNNAPAGGVVFITVRNPYERMFSRWNHNTFADKKKGRGYTSMRERGVSFINMCRKSAVVATSPIAYNHCIFLRIEDIAEQIKKLPFYNPDYGAPKHMRKNAAKEESFFDVFAIDSDEAAAVRITCSQEFKKFKYSLGSANDHFA